MESHRSWFPVILTGLSVALGVLIFAAYEPGERATETSTLQVPTTAPTADEYQSAITAALSDEAHANAAATREVLKKMQVPAEYLALHLQLVFAYNDYVDGNVAEGDARMEALRVANTWLP